MVSHKKFHSISNRLRRCVLTLPVMLLVFTAVARAEVTLQVDRDRVVEGETVTLTFITDNPRQNLDADFSALESDFHILDRRSETQLSIVSGKQTAIVRLLLTVEPKTSGELVIPAISFGDSSSNAVALKVDAAPQLAPGELPPVFIEVEIAPRFGPRYVHAQFGLDVRVFYQQNLTEAAISPPEPAHAAVRLLQETPYQADRGGVRYRVLERRYAIFPERSGELVIPAMQLSGRLVERRTSGVWQPTVRGRRVSVESEALVLDIQPRPDSFNGSAWQPAREFRLSQQVSAGDALRVGEPVTRTIIIDAIGLEEHMITEPESPAIAHARIYPDKPQGISRDDGQWVLGHKEFRYAVVPEKEGELVLPELTVYWWNTVTDQKQKAVLPAHTLEVQASALVPPAAPGAPPPGDTMRLAPAESHAVREDGSGSTLWRGLALLFATLWLLTLLFALRMKKGRTGHGKPREAGAIPEDEAALLNQFRQACMAADQHEARRIMKAWLASFGPGTGASLLEFAAQLDDAQLRGNIRAMDSDGFRPDGSERWDGKKTWAAFDAWRRNRAATRRVQSPPLTDLYAPENR